MTQIKPLNIKELAYGALKLKDGENIVVDGPFGLVIVLQRNCEEDWEVQVGAGEDDEWSGASRRLDQELHDRYDAHFTNFATAVGYVSDLTPCGNIA